MNKDWHELISQPEYEVMLEEDVWVTMRDGIRLCVDIHRPAVEGKFPALVQLGGFGKDLPKLPTCPEFRGADFLRATGGREGIDISYFVSRGYVLVAADDRGVGKSEGNVYESDAQDGYDLIEWTAEQPWCNGNVGMLGIMGFAIAQNEIAAEQPPHLKAIFPFDGTTDRYRHGNYQGGILNYMLPSQLSTAPRRVRRLPQPLSFKEFGPEEFQEKIRELQNNPDIRCTPFLYLITVCPDIFPRLLDIMLHPYDGPYYHKRSVHPKLKDIKIPAYYGVRWTGWDHNISGPLDAYENASTPREQKKLLAVPSNNYVGMDRPFHEIQDVCLRWCDHWLKGIDTGIMDEPPILIFIQGTNKWRYENEWPLAATQWTKFYLRSGGKLSTDSPGADEKPEVFTSDPWAWPTQGFNQGNPWAKADPVPKIVYETEPLSENAEVIGPLALYWHASIESKGIRARTPKGIKVLEPLTNDTDWYLHVKDIDGDGSERDVAKGWLKASHYELDESKSKPYAPYHPHTRSLPIKPGEVILYASDLRMTSNVFLTGHKIRLEISGQDQAQGQAYHLPHMAEVKHTIHSTRDLPSYLLLPVIPRGYEGAGEPACPPEGPFRTLKHRKTE